MSEDSIELIKFGPKGPKSSKLDLVESSDLPVGGLEGQKSKTALKNPYYKAEKTGVSPTLDFVSKEYALNDKDRVLEVIKTYGFLRSRGYPVPQTTRYYEKNGKIYLLMTDMTEGGKYKLWGYSDELTPEQEDALKDMSLSEEDMSAAEKIANELAAKATKDRIYLLNFYYHIRKDVDTGAIDVVLLDVGSEHEVKASERREDRNVESVNSDGAQKFIGVIRELMVSEP